MAQSFLTEKGVLLIDPGTYVETEVRTAAQGTPTIGLITIIGEADEGPDWSLEADLDQNLFDPSELGAVIQKYGSGRIVDAFRKLTSPADDPAIVGAVTGVKIVKTNKSVAAQSAVSTAGVEYGVLSARRRGKPGNLIKRSSAVSQAEVAPKTIDLAYTPSFDPNSFSLRANGSAEHNVVISAKASLDALISALTNVEKGLMAVTDGVVEAVSGLSGVNATATVDALNGYLVVSLAAGSQFAGDIEVGDSVVIPDAGDYSVISQSILAGASGFNIGSYIIVSVTNTATTAQLVLQPIHTAGAIEAVGSTPVQAEEKDLLVFKKVRLENRTGQDRNSFEGMTGTFTTSAVINGVITLTAPSPFAAQPQVGDLVTVFGADAGLNLPDGFYQVVSADEDSVDLIKLDPVDIGSGSGSYNQLTAIEGDFDIKVKKRVIDGLGKTLEVVGDVSDVLVDPSTGEEAGISDSLLVSDAELEMLFTVARGTQIENYLVGGVIAVEIGSVKDGATVEIEDDKLTLKHSSGDIEIEYSQYGRLSELVDYINSQTDYHARLTNARFGFLQSQSLDNGTFGISAADETKYSARVKTDAGDFAAALAASALVSFSSTASSGLPEENLTETFLAGGSRGGSTGAEFVAAIDACEDLDTNFVVLLISQDASADITAGETDLSSTYSIDATNAYLKSHALKMSQVENRKPRLALGSKLAEFTEDKEAAGALSSHRFALTMQSVRDVRDGQPFVFQPWMAAIVAAGMQAAGTYKGIVKKFANIGGFIDPVGFNSKNIGQRKDALRNGLLFLESVNTGGFRWVSDQTTYSVDNNFVFNSLQANYIADLITLDLIDTYDRVAAGQSVAEMTAAAALAVLEARMSDYRRLKWIAPSDDAPLGFLNPSVKLRGGALQIKVEIKLAGLIYFIPISLSISEVVQTA